MRINHFGSKETYPAVLFVSGGGFMANGKNNSVQQRVALAEAGYVVASIECRVVPTALFPSPLEDVKTAVRYLRANAQKWGIDPNHIAVMGESAGGYLAALVGTTSGTKTFDKGEYLEQSSDVQAVIDLYGLSDLTRVGADFPESVQKVHESPAAPEALLLNGAAVKETPEKAAAANPINYISKATPPFLLMHGDQDNVVSPSQTELLHQALIKNGIDSTRYIVKGAGHNGPEFYQPELIQVMINFLDQVLKNK